MATWPSLWILFIISSPNYFEKMWLKTARSERILRIDRRNQFRVFAPKLCDPLLSPLISIETRVIVAFFIVFANVYKTAQVFLKVSLSPPAEISTVTVFFLDFLIQHCNITPVIKLDNFEIYFLLGWWLVGMFLVSYFFFICRKVWIILSEIWDFEMFAPCISWGVFVDVNSVWGQVINSQHYKRGKGIKNLKHDEQKKEF